jgi:hypothetical protein
MLPGRRRLTDSKEIQESRLRCGIQTDAVRDVVFLGGKEGRHRVRLKPQVTGPVNHAMHGPAEMMGRHQGADRKGLEMHDGHLSFR